MDVQRSQWWKYRPSAGPGTRGDQALAAWRPVSVPSEAAAFARQVVARVAPARRDRAKNLLWAAGKLAGYGTG
jgi:hypothetical protein